LWAGLFDATLKVSLTPQEIEEIWSKNIADNLLKLTGGLLNVFIKYPAIAGYFLCSRKVAAGLCFCFWAADRKMCLANMIGRRKI